MSSGLCQKGGSSPKFIEEKVPEARCHSLVWAEHLKLMMPAIGWSVMTSSVGRSLSVWVLNC